MDSDLNQILHFNVSTFFLNQMEQKNTFCGALQNKKQQQFSTFYLKKLTLQDVFISSPRAVITKSIQGCPTQYQEFLRYSKGLTFSQKPDYVYCQVGQIRLYSSAQDFILVLRILFIMKWIRIQVLDILYRFTDFLNN